MPYKDAQRRRDHARVGMRRLRERRRVESACVQDPAAALADWAKRRLVVPAGHPLAGQALELAPFLVSFLRDALAPGIQEALLTVSRKNAKSAACAVLALGHLAPDGPLRRKGWRCAIVSITKLKASELRRQIQEISEASNLEGLDFRKSPAPGPVLSPYGSIEVIPAEKYGGHASGFDLVLIDETGLLSERDRPLINGMLSSVSARAGRVVHISIRGDGPFVPELIKRKDDPAVVVHQYAAAPDCALDDEKQWRKANPGLGTIKSLAYMRAAARRAKASPGDQAHFRAHDLNQAVSPGKGMIVSVDDWQKCIDAGDAPREGPCCIGIDTGLIDSFTAVAAYWPESGRLEVFAGIGDSPDLATRGEADGVGMEYVQMRTRGEIMVWPGRKAPAGEMVRWLINHLDGQEVIGAAADRYRKVDVEQALIDGDGTWGVDFRPVGAGPDGSTDVRLFQRAVLDKHLRPGLNKYLERCILNSELRFNGNGDPALEKGNQRGRIDGLSAAVLAVGVGERERSNFSYFA